MTDERIKCISVSHDENDEGGGSGAGNQFIYFFENQTIVTNIYSALD